MATTDGDRSAAAAGPSAPESELEHARRRVRELDHRIKNDLQLISSVFVLQLRRMPEGEGRDAIRGALERINAVAAVHRRLDVGHDPGRFELSGLVRDVTEEAAGAARRDDVRLSLELEPVVTASRQAAPLALIVGELVRNALRHAFPGRGGQVTVRLGKTGEGLELAVEDDGVGLPDGAPPAGFGTTLAALLAQQVRGRLEITDRHPGVRAAVRFPESL
jgi:two-component sensor histidine kinase